MTEIRGGLTEEETSGNGGREMTSVRERRGMGEKEEGKKMRRDEKVKEGKNKDRKA